MTTQIKKTFAVDQLVLKSTGAADGKFSGWLACYGNLDRDGEICAPGCFKKSIQEDPVIPILWQHDRSRPIGWGRVTDMPTGVKLDGDLLLDTTDGKTAYSFMRKAAEFDSSARVGLSVGFQPDDGGIKMVDGRRTFTSARLLEGSVVTFPANPQAFVTQVKHQKNWTSFGDYARAVKALPTFSMPEPRKGPITFEEAYEEAMLEQQINKFLGQVKALNAQLRRR